MSQKCQFRKSQRERYRTEIDCDFFALQAAIDQIGLLGRLITYLVQEFCEWRRRRGDRHVDKHSSGRKKKSRRVPGGSSRLAVSGQAPSRPSFVRP